MLSSTSTSDYLAVGVASASSVALVGGQIYKVVSTTDCLIKMNSATPTASAADDCHLITAGRPFFFLNQTLDHKVALIRVAADGVATISLAMSGE